MTNLQLWLNELLARDAAGTLAAFAPGASLSIASASGNYVNGVGDVVAGGFFTSEAAEQVRAQALADGGAMATWANNVLPHKFALLDLTEADSPVTLSEADAFSVRNNVGRATLLSHQLSPNTPYSTWWPQGCIATPDPTRKKLAISGPIIPGYATFPSNVHLADLPGIFQAAYEAAKAAAAQGGVHFGNEADGGVV